MDVRDNDVSTFGDPDEAEGYHWYLCPIVEKIEKGKPVCDIDKLVHKIATGRINRYDVAHEADSCMDGILHKRLAIDLRMGEMLKHLKKQGVSHLGYRSIGSFSVEHLSFSGRLASEMMHRFDVLSALPLTKRAYLQCEIMKSALRYTSRVMTPQNEAEWLSLAQALSLNDLEREVRCAIEESAAAADSTDRDGKTGASGENFETDAGGEGSETGAIGEGSEADTGGEDSGIRADITECEPDIPSEESDEERKGVMMHLNVPHKLALIWDFAVEHFRNKEHYSGPLAGFVEAILANYLASGGGAPGNSTKKNSAPEAMYGDLPLFPEKNESVNAMYGDRLPFPEKNESVPIFYSYHMRPAQKPRLSHINEYEPPKRDEGGSYDDGPQRLRRLVLFPSSFDEIPESVRDKAERLIEYALMRQALDVAMGKLLWAMRYQGLYKVFNCGSIEEYAINYCDLSKPLLYRLMRLADGMERHPLIRDAFESDHISKEQARLVLRIVDKKNEKAWIDYAAHVPTATLKEEVERCRRILEYDCLAAGYYAILPGFRYITDDRFHGLPEEIQNIIRTGAWYQSPSMISSWPLEEDDEQDVMDRDPRLEEPWKYFEDVDEFLLYEAETAEMREKKRRHDSRAGQAITGQGDVAAKCAALTGQEFPGQETPGQGTVSSKCPGNADLHTDSRRNVTSPLCAVSAACATEIPSKRSQSGKTACSCGSCEPRRNEEALSRAREICTMPHNADPAETFLMDILEDDSGSLKGAGMSIRFFLPEELYELWNMMAMNWLMQATAEEMGLLAEDCAQVEVGTDSFFYQKEVSPREKRVSPPFRTKEITVEEVNESPMRYIGYAEDFLVALLQDYLLTERIHLKVASNYAILKRDHFQCQVPGCKCRRNLQVHHIIWRSKGGSDEHFNLITLCKAHHKHILHDMMALKIEGTAPHNLTFTFGSNSSDGDGPFLIYHKGRKKRL
ncbi:MAG: HNH endonuclease [Vulcanimicrobiota bacterium]